MNPLVSYQLNGGIATVTMDDGKVNAMSPQMIGELNAALDRATTDRAAIVLTGRPGVFSGGFDLTVMARGGANAYEMLMGGFELAGRILSFPAPVVMACNGHALAMGVFILQAGDYRIGVNGPHKIGANETAIGLNLPHTTIEICRQRLAPAHFNRALINAEIYSPADAVAAGFLDRVVEETELQTEAQAMITRLAKYNRATLVANKQLVRGQAIKTVTAALDADRTELAPLKRK
ncbi:MAG: crotonase/enoyl-CoA hydratase family protein [Nevskiales bacterium]